ncbi:MAG: sporulation protein YabP [Clostridiales bacterium]|nr:sporulation protein YabP [Clostridiales bacterium]
MDRSQEKGNRKPHQVTVVDCHRAEITGVLHVENFDRETAVLWTDYGVLTISGRDLHIQQLELPEGRFAVEGQISGLVWSDQGGPRGKGKSFWARLVQ